MGSTFIFVDKKGNNLWISIGFAELIAGLIEKFLSKNYISDFYQKNKTLMDLVDLWKIVYSGINLNDLSQRDFQTVVESLEKGQAYLETLVKEADREEFVKGYIGVLAFDDLKHWVRKTLEHCYKDPRWISKTV